VTLYLHACVASIQCVNEEAEVWLTDTAVNGVAEMQHAGHKRTASEREATDEDFIIHCSQSYTRTASQSLQGSEPSQVCQVSEAANYQCMYLP